jgi:hypothetical protein
MLAPGLSTGCGVERRARVTIDFAARADELRGREVVLDGLVVGTLSGPDGAARASFPLPPGSHEIRIRHPRLESVAAHVQAAGEGERLRLLADIEESWADGRLRPRIVLR